jgi:tetratricopeptide (TPR) repeat protein
MKLEELCERGFALQEQGRLAEARDCYKKILVRDPRHFGGLLLAAQVCVDAGQNELALTMATRAVGAQPDHAGARSLVGEAQTAMGLLEDAVASFDRAVALDPTLASAHNGRGLALQELDRAAEALASFDRAIALMPRAAALHYNRGRALAHLYRLDEALRAYDMAAALDALDPDIHNNKAQILNMLGRHAEAIDSLDKAIATGPQNQAEYKFNKSFCLLALGDFEQGWRLHEHRRGLKRPEPEFGRPLWLGQESVEGKTVLLHSEQGLGDTIQFIRYSRLVEARGARVKVLVQAPLKALLSQSGHEVFAWGEDCGHFDYRCPLMSLPHALDTRLENVPGETPYLSVSREKSEYWRTRFAANGRKRVGLVWNGGFRPDQPELHRLNARRNIPFSDMAKLNREGMDFVSLQKGEPAESELRDARHAIWPSDNLYDISADLKDFSDTAAVIDNLDLVISVDTSVAHLAGAMGKPTWILVRYDGCWRWLMDRDDSPWYPTARLFRQSSFGDWSSALEAVGRELMAL